MGLLWNGELANAGEFDTAGTLQGEVWGDISRTNNTVSITNIFVKQKANAGSVFDDWEWYGDCQVPSGSLVLNTAQTKGRTGSSNLGGIWYQSGSTSTSFGVSAGTSSINIQSRWKSLHWGTSSAYRQFSVGIPTVSAPSTPSVSSTNVTTNSGRVNWSVGSAGSNCTYSSTTVEWGLTTGYGSSQGGLGQNSNLNITGLIPGTTYYYRVTAINGAGLTSSNTGSFQTVPTSFMFMGAPL